MKEILSYLIIVILLLMVGYQYIFKQQIITEKYQVDTILVRDTIRIWMPAKVHYKKVYVEKNDTIREKTYYEIKIDTNTWNACIDTLVNKTHINACFFYPSKFFRIDIETFPDTITKYVTIEKPLLKYEQKQSKWYEDVLKIGGGIGLGFILGKIR